jgi:hypothetical protein
MEAVDIVKINELITIYKDGQEANNIQVARISELNSDISCQFNIIVGKNLYNIGDKVLYIQPDYCIPNTSYFKEYYEPFGDPKKSKLGKNGRIKAVKFNFNFKDEFDPIYSNGIILDLNILSFDITDNINLEKELNIIKYEAEDSFEKGGSANELTKGDLPSFLYATDETRIELLKEHVDKCYKDNEVLSFTIKRDGSSATIYCKIINNEYSIGICSRKQEKKLEQTYALMYTDDDEHILIKYYNKNINKHGFFNQLSKKFYTEEECIANNFKPTTKKIKDAWVDTINENNYLNKLLEYCNENKLELALRGELIGGGNKGSGNKLNQDAKLNRHIVWFGVDDLSEGFAKRINYSDTENNLKSICEKLDLIYTKEINEGVYDYSGIIKFCTETFQKIKEETGQIIEGIVIRTKYSNRLSTKYINPEYDAKSN